MESTYRSSARRAAGSEQRILITQNHVLWYQVRFSTLLKDDDGDESVRALLVNLVTTVLAGEERP